MGESDDPDGVLRRAEVLFDPADGTSSMRLQAPSRRIPLPGALVSAAAFGWQEISALLRGELEFKFHLQ